MVELGKRERLRKGEYVELEPGVHGRLNKENRTLELSTGKILPISEKNQRDLFPENEQRANIARKKESLEKEIEENPLGEFGYQFGQSGIANAAKNWVNKFTKSSDEYEQGLEAEREVSRRISEESPYISAGATAASFLPDIYATGGMSALKAAPLLTAAHAGPRIIEEPGQVAKEVALSAGSGFLLDKATSFLNKVAARRSASRNLPSKQAEVKALNVAGKLENEAMNLEEQEIFNALKTDIKNKNQLALEQHNLALETRQNDMIQAKNNYQQALQNRTATADEIKRLSNEYQIAQKAHEESLKEIPALQKKAQEEYSNNVIHNANRISNNFPESSKIFSNQFGVPDYIEESVMKSGLAGTKEGRQVTNILNSLFPEGEILTGKDLARKYTGLENSIQKATGDVKGALVGFKEYIGEKIPMILADNMAYKKIIPSLKNQITKDVENAIESMGLQEHGIGSKSYYLAKARSNVDQIFREITPENFMEKYQNGDITQLIKDKVMRPQDFEFSFNIGRLTKEKAKKDKMLISEDLAEKLGVNTNRGKESYDRFMFDFDNRLNKSIGTGQRKLIATDIDAQKKLGRSVRNTYGLAGEVPIPEAPSSPNLPQLPPNPQIPTIPPIPGKPGIIPTPQAPQPNLFNPLPEPTLSPPTGIAQQTGDLLEKKLLGGKSLANNPITKLAGLKYALGGAALPLEAAYGGAKLLTSPTALGEGARMTFKQGGIQFIDQLARKYPSYHNGILDNPVDRRSLTKEIEDNFEIPSEEKAMIQSRINRGKPLESRLQ